MNVNDIELVGEKPEDLLQDIFKHQHSLATKYLDIEASNGLLQTRDFPVNIHDNKGQARIKDMFWRATEEIAEAMEALDMKEYTHFYEELGDALHFLVEAFLLADIYPGDALPAQGSCHDDDLEYMFDMVSSRQPPNTETISKELVELHVAEFVKRAGLACNCLKNKPWKQTHMLTDCNKFKSCMNRAFKAFIALCKVSGFNAEGLYYMYMRKNQVNIFRQRSGY